MRPSELSCSENRDGGAIAATEVSPSRRPLSKSRLIRTHPSHAYSNSDYIIS